jgi:putative transposase
VPLFVGNSTCSEALHYHRALDTGCFDNAVAESFWSTLKAERVELTSFDTRQGGRQAIFEYMKIFYNRRRLHSTLGHCSPAD